MYARVSPEWLNSPLGLAGFLVRFPGLSVSDKAAALSASLKMLEFEFYVDYDRLDEISFQAWAERAGFPESIVSSLFNTIIPSHFYLPLAEVSAAAVLSGRPNYFGGGSHHVSVLAQPPHRALLEPIAGLIRHRGGSITVNRRAEHFEADRCAIKAIWATDQDGRPIRVEGNHFISAVDVSGFQRIIKPIVPLHPSMASVFRLDSPPVIVARVWTSRIITSLPTIVGHFIGGALLHTFFHVTQFQPEAVSSGDLIEIQMGPVQGYIDLPEAELKRSILRELEQYIPEFSRTSVRKVQILKHFQGFTSYRVGSERYRLEVDTPWANLLLAGDWIRVPSPVFAMERAVLSGILAANGILVREFRCPKDDSTGALSRQLPLWPSLVTACLSTFKDRSMPSDADT